MQLTSLVDLASRTLCAAVLRPHGTRAVNATLLLARVVVPEHDAPGWAGALRLRASRLPHRDLGLLRLIATRARSVNFASTVWRSGTGWRSPWYFIGNSTGQASPTGRRPWREPSVALGTGECIGSDLRQRAATVVPGGYSSLRSPQSRPVRCRVSTVGPNRLMRWPARVRCISGIISSSESLATMQ